MTISRAYLPLLEFYPVYLSHLILISEIGLRERKPVRRDERSNLQWWTGILRGTTRLEDRFTDPSAVHLWLPDLFAGILLTVFRYFAKFATGITKRLGEVYGLVFKRALRALSAAKGSRMVPGAIWLR